ncbi:hypothetical protein SynA1840_02176 [Synechococcus sp. A18-40]|nr:hypothetical protein SynA1840_02176 [Synechococcus sp. A18-40]
MAIPDGHSEIKKFSPFSAAESALILEELLKAKELGYVPLALVVMTTGCKGGRGLPAPAAGSKADRARRLVLRLALRADSC